MSQERTSYREQRGFALADAFAQDVRFACRVLIRDRGFAMTAILVLAVGIGVNNMMFTLVYGSTLRGLPIAQAGRVLYISTFDQRFPDRALSYPEFVDLREARSFSGLVAYVNAAVAVGEERRAPDRVDGTYLTSNAFDVVGTMPIMGRGLAPDDERPGAAAVAILGSKIWRARYQGDPSILGRAILVNGVPATVVGVMPDASGFPSTAEVWFPLARLPSLAMDTRDARMLRVFGRVRDGVALADAIGEIESIVERGARVHPESSLGLQARVVPINQRFFGPPTQPTWLAFITASVLIVIVSCANAANLLLARSVLRVREIAIRGTLGASRRRIVGQLLIESLILAALGGTVGLFVSLAAVRLFQSAIPENVMPYWLDYSMDAKVFGALVVVSFLTVLVFGLVPALKASNADVNRVLKDCSRSATATGDTRRLTFAFLAAEIALSVVLMAQAVVSAQSGGNSLASDASIDTTEILTASVTLPATQYPTPAQRRDFYARIVQRLSAIPGVTSGSLASALPLHGSLQQSLDIEGHTRGRGETAPTVSTISIGRRYFDTFDVPIVRGRGFDNDDGLPGREHVVVSQRFAETHLAGTDPIGQRIRLAMANEPTSAPGWHTIVGVSADVRQHAVPGAESVVYLPINASPPSTAAIIVRSAGDSTALTRSVRNAMLGVDSNLPLYRVMTMQQAIRDAQWNGRVSHGLVTMLTCIALGLSLAGLYAVTMYSVGQRTHEIGIRMALGARPDEIRLLILRNAFLPVAAGLALGLAGSVLWDAVFSSGSTAGGIDPRLVSTNVMIPVVALLAGATVAACLIPARRAARLDPAEALRQE